jgi:hypothetical protein
MNTTILDKLSQIQDDIAVKLSLASSMTFVGGEAQANLKIWNDLYTRYLPQLISNVAVSSSEFPIAKKIDILTDAVGRLDRALTGDSTVLAESVRMLEALPDDPTIPLKP